MSIVCGENGRIWVDGPLRVGDIAKVTLPGETPWAEVVEVISARRFVGAICNHCLLVEEHGYDYQDELVFQVIEDEERWWAEPAKPKDLN